jgi:LAS superfamily LD-carboxypeptidase LdcB
MTPSGRDFTLPELTGQARAHVVELPGAGCTLHRETAPAFLAMRAAAAADGIDLVAFSSFRDFDRQLTIWNEKFQGIRPMQDRAGAPLEALQLTPRERVEAILWWSALPGASRHHWGTDFDVMDLATRPAGYRIQVIPEEYAADGIFAPLTRWLDARMHEFGFFRPYSRDLGGVRPEPWHLSHAPVAERAAAAFKPEFLAAAIANAAIEGRDEILGMLPVFFERYVVNVEPAPMLARMGPKLS